MATYSKYEKKGKEFWEYRIYYKDTLTQKNVEKKKRGFTSKGEAKAHAEAVERDLKDGFREDNETLKDYIFYWLDSHKKGVIRDSTVENKLNAINKHILPYYQDMLLKDAAIKPKFYQGYIDMMAEKGYARSTIEVGHWVMHAVFERAIIEKKIKDNPAAIATLKGREKSAEDLEYIPTNQVGDLLQEIYRKNFEYYVFFKTLVETGMRKGEATGLTWDCIDFENKQITINKAMDTQHGKFIKTKTVSSKRTIDVVDRVLDDLKKLRKRQLENKMAFGAAYDKNNLVFCRPNGKFYPKSTLFNVFNKAQRATGIFAGKDANDEPVCYSIHSLRHTHAVMCLENEMDMKTLQERLGHGAYEITANVYSHVSDKMKKKSLEKYEQGTSIALQPKQEVFHA